MFLSVHIHYITIQSYPYNCTFINRHDIEPVADVHDDAGHGVVAVQRQQRLLHHARAAHMQLVHQDGHERRLEIRAQHLWSAQHHLQGDTSSLVFKFVKFSLTYIFTKLLHYVWFWGQS